MVRPLVLPSATREFVHVPVPGSATLTTPPDMAFTATADEPEDDAWHEAAWADGAARLMIGPDEGAVPLTAGRYRIWVRFTAGAERPVRNTGLLFIT